MGKVIKAYCNKKGVAENSVRWAYCEAGRGRAFCVSWGGDKCYGCSCSLRHGVACMSRVAAAAHRWRLPQHAHTRCATLGAAALQQQSLCLRPHHGCQSWCMRCGWAGPCMLIPTRMDVPHTDRLMATAVHDRTAKVCHAPGLPSSPALLPASPAGLSLMDTEWARTSRQKR